jgi:glutathione S-transferase
MAVKLHRCGTMWLKIDAHPCWRVQKSLDEAGVEYEVVKHPLMRGKRTEVEEKTGQKALPAIELEDGRWIREQSKDLAARVREDRLRA